MADLATTVKSSAKDFLTRQEKGLGFVGTFLAGCVGIGVLFKALPFITSFLERLTDMVGKALVLGGELFLAFVVLMFLTNPRTWSLLKHVQYAFARWLSLLAIKQNPVARMRAFADEYLQEQFQRYNDATSVVEQQLNNTRRDIERATGELNDAAGIVRQLQKKHYDPATKRWDDEDNHNQFRLQAQRVQFLEDTLKKLRTGEARLAMVVKVLDKCRSIFRFKIDSTKQSADFLERQLVSAQGTADALEAATSAFGGGDMARFDEMTRAYIEDQISGSVARIEVFLEAIPELTTLADLRGDIAEDGMMERLREWDSETDKMYAESQGDQAKLTSGDPSLAVEVIQRREPVPVGRYSGLLGSRGSQKG